MKRAVIAFIVLFAACHKPEAKSDPTFDAQWKQATAAAEPAYIESHEIDPAGTVQTVRVDAPAFAASKLPDCISTRAKAWTFPKFTDGPKKFSYPFVFV